MGSGLPVKTYTYLELTGYLDKKPPHERPAWVLYDDHREELAKLRAELAQEKVIARGAGLDAERALERAEKAETTLAERDVDLEAQSKIVDGLRAESEEVRAEVLKALGRESEFRIEIDALQAKLAEAERERDTHIDTIGAVAGQRDAAIRERDEFRAALDSTDRGFKSTTTALIEQRDAATALLRGVSADLARRGVELDTSIEIEAFLAAQPAASEAPKAPYGFCPKCGDPGVTRERRPNGDDTCKRGHKYPSKDAQQAREGESRWESVSEEAAKRDVIDEILRGDDTPSDAGGAR